MLEFIVILSLAFLIASSIQVANANIEPTSIKSKNPLISIEAISQIAHDANLSFCRTLQDFTQVPWESAPEELKANTRNSVLAIIAQPDITPSRLHEIWMEDKIKHGWKLGLVKDAELKTHPLLIPYEKLDLKNRLKDSLFHSIVKSFLE